MNQEISPLRTALLLCVFLSLIGAYIYAGFKIAEIPYPATISVSDDQLIIPYARQEVMIFNTYGELTGNMKFAESGYENAFVSATLINAHEFIIYANPRNEKQRNLYRCDVILKNCSVFSDKLPQLTLGSTLLWDAQLQELYVAASSEHALFKLNEQGEITARYDTGLRYPNGLTLDSDAVWLISSGNNQLVGFERNARAELKEIKRIKLQIDSGCGHRASIIDMFRADPFCEPVSVLAMKNSFWVLIKTKDLAQGRVDEYDRQGNFRVSQGLYPDANPAGLTLWRDEILISDRSAQNIVRMDQGGQWRVFDPTSLRQRREAFMVEQQKYEHIKSIALWIFIPLFVIGLGIGIYQEYKRKKDAAAIDQPQTLGPLPEAAPDAESRAGEYWLKPSLKKKMFERINLFFPILLIICVLGLISLAIYSQKSMWDLVCGMIVIGFVMGRLFFVLGRSMRVRVAVKGRMMLFRDYSGAVDILPVEAVRITKAGLIHANGRFYNFGRDFMFIAKEDVSAHLLPRIPRMQPMGEIESMRLMWNGASVLDKVLLVAVLLVSLVVIIAF